MLHLERGKRGPDEPADHALGRSRGGPKSICSATPTGYRCASFSLAAKPATLVMPSPCLMMSASRQANVVVHASAATGYRLTRATTPRPCAVTAIDIGCSRSSRSAQPGLPRLFDRPKYRQRNIIERMFGWLKENRRIVTRFDKLAKNYAAMVSLACVMLCM